MLPLIIIDWIRSDYSLRHGGRLRDYVKQGFMYVEGHVLEVYEGWLGRERVRYINAYVRALVTSDRVYLPRDDMLKYGVAPKTWVVFAVVRAGDPEKEQYVPVYPYKVVPYIPSKDLLVARFEELALRMAGLSSKISGIVYRTYGVIEELRTAKAVETKKKRKEKLKIRKKRRLFKR